MKTQLQEWRCAFHSTKKENGGLARGDITENTAQTTLGRGTGRLSTSRLRITAVTIRTPYTPQPGFHLPSAMELSSTGSELTQVEV